MTAADWLSKFPGLRYLDRESASRLLATSRVLQMPAGTHIFGPGQKPEAYLLLLAGTVRIHQVSESGREIVLYRVSAGESCALTTACLLGHEDYNAEGIAETDITAVALPRTSFDEAIAHSEIFRQFVFQAFSTRISNLFRIIEEVAFARIDVRLAQKLTQLAGSLDHVDMTHQQLASELGTAREVISRQLHEFQRRGWITTARGTIAIIDRSGLTTLAQTA